MASRRYFTLGLVAAGLWLSKPRSVFAAPDASGPSCDGPTELIAFIAALPCSEPLGYACLRALQSPRIPSSLAQLLIRDLDLKSNDCSTQGIRTKVRQRIRMDFEASRIVDVDGWCLSLTETRLYAVSFLQR